MRRFEWIKGIFSFSKAETRGIIVLLIILMVLLVIKFVMYKKLDKYDLQSYSSNDTTITSESEGHFNNPLGSASRSKLSKVISQPVDPNTASYKDLTAIGMPSRVARTLIKYREKGGVYSTPGDLLKVYGFDSSLYSTLKNFLYFRPKKTKPDSNSKIPDRIFSIELNRSDSLALERLPGIGPVLAARIIKYRNILGGFYSSEQLSEVYGITDSLFAVLTKFIETDTFLISKMNLNSLTLEEFEQHPYLNRYQAKAIISYRRLIGPFTSVNQLVANYLVPEETYYRLLPYLTVN